MKTRGQMSREECQAHPIFILQRLVRVIVIEPDDFGFDNDIGAFTCTREDKWLWNNKEIKLGDEFTMEDMVKQHLATPVWSPVRVYASREEAE
jgi:hypothetical protein